MKTKTNCPNFSLAFEIFCMFWFGNMTHIRVYTSHVIQNFKDDAWSPRPPDCTVWDIFPRGIHKKLFYRPQHLKILVELQEGNIIAFMDEWEYFNACTSLIVRLHKWESCPRSIHTEDMSKHNSNMYSFCSFSCIIHDY